MCGIAGFLNNSTNNSESILNKMVDSLAHRGPDDEGYWFDRDAGIALGHRRLSILDLSPAGHQPMNSHSGRFVIIFNGEIYNYHLIRAELEKLATYNWRGHSDTEVILEAFEVWGIEKTIKRLIGMFAIALWDRKERLLYLIRDRLGEKPLYYGAFGRTLIFGSELKSLKVHPAFNAEIDHNALALYMRYCYVPTPYTIYKGVYKLTPGSIITFSKDSLAESNHAPVPYWSVHETVTQGLSQPFSGTDKEAINALETLLLDAVRQEMVADVPLGAFLSGGIDSSLIAALMQAQSPRPIKTFTIGYEDKQYNEAAQAKEVSRHLGVNHTELYVSSEKALGIIPMLPRIYDEPFGDSSQIPTFLISQMTRQHVTVSLSGDAGDELFGGYNRYVWGKGIWNSISWMPQVFRRITSASITALSPQSWNRLSELFPQKFRQRILGERMHKLAGMLGANSHYDMYRQQVSTWKDTSKIMTDAVEYFTPLTNKIQWLDTEDFIQQMMYLDLITYLPDDILVKLDRAAMTVSLETRVPFLDHRVVEFAWKLPLSLKIKNGQGKWILRQILYKYVPKQLIERPKMGFGVPIDMWLRGPLREWAESLLNKDRLLREGFFNPDPILNLWNEHLSGRRNWQHQLWNVLMFQAWLENETL